MNELRRILRNQLRPAVGALALGCLVPFQVAAEVADPAFNRFRSQVIGNSVNFSYGSSGAPLGGANTATGIGVTSGVDVARPTTVNTKHGPINGTLAQKLSSSSMAKAMVRLRAAGSLVTPLGLAFLAASFVGDFLADAGLGVDSSGTFTAVEERHPTYDDPYEYQYSGTAWHLSAMGACGAWIAAFSGGQFTWRNVAFVAPTTCTAERQQSGFTTWFTITQSINRRARQTQPLPPAYVPVSDAVAEAALSSVTNPSPEVLRELYKLGETLNLANPIPDLVDTLRAEFEARSPETTTTETAESPAETKTEEKTCATYTQVVANVLSLVEQCETSTTTQPKDPVTGEPVGAPTVTTTTSSSNAPDPKAEESAEAEGLCKLFPDIAACAKLGTETLEIPRGERSVSYSAESVFGAGTCPADKTFVAYGQTLQLTNMAQACDLLATYVKPIAILLAAFTALMIVAVGVPE